jgi:hypothetical protein
MLWTDVFDDKDRDEDDDDGCAEYDNTRITPSKDNARVEGQRRHWQDHEYAAMRNGSRNNVDSALLSLAQDARVTSRR